MPVCPYDVLGLPNRLGQSYFQRFIILDYQSNSVISFSSRNGGKGEECQCHVDNGRKSKSVNLCSLLTERSPRLLLESQPKVEVGLGEGRPFHLLEGN